MAVVVVIVIVIVVITVVMLVAVAVVVMNHFKEPSIVVIDHADHPHARLRRRKPMQPYNTTRHSIAQRKRGNISVWVTVQTAQHSTAQRNRGNISVWVTVQTSQHSGGNDMMKVFIV